MADRSLINSAMGGWQPGSAGVQIQSAMGGSQDGGGTPTPTPSPTRGGFVLGGQSLANRSFAKNDDTTTIAAAGATISPNTRIMATYSESGAPTFMPAIGDLVWGVPSDAGPYSSAFTAALPYYMEKFGYPAGVDLIGHAVGNTPISSWQPGQPNYERLLANTLRAVSMGAVPKFAAIFIGHRDATDGTTAAAFKAGLDGYFNGLKASVPTIQYLIVMTIPWNNSTIGGSAAQMLTIRKAASEWCATNSASYIAPQDINLSDGVHPGQIGEVAMARAAARAARPSLGLAGSHLGPTIASVVRDTVNTKVVMTFNLPAGATSLVKTGDPSPRIQVYQAGTYTTAFAVQGLVVGTNTITFNDLAPSTAIDVWLDADPQSGPTDGTSAVIRDNHIEADEAAAGMTVGRTIAPTLAPFNVAASTAVPGYRYFEYTNTNNGDNKHPGDSGYRWGCPEIQLFDGATAISNAGATASGGNVPAQPSSRLVDGSTAADFSSTDGQPIVIDMGRTVDAGTARFPNSVDGGVANTWTGGLIRGRKDGSSTWVVLSAAGTGSYDGSGVPVALAR